jgi:citrate lyase subunit beta / citryl-CoA lyase
MKPRRSVLFMPGSNARALDKARTLPADALVLDLEDAVAPEMKAPARAQVLAACVPAATAVARSSSGRTRSTRRGATMTCRRWPPPAPMPCMLETPRGILNAASIATASPRVAALVMGTSDLTKDLHARATRERIPLLTSLQLCVLAARAAGITALDGVHLDLDDDAGFAAACRQAADFGFDGKTLIHPKQVATANEVFAPAASDVDWARRVIAAHADAVAGGRGVVVLDGRLIENLHVDDARRVLALAEAIAERAR